jgi:hypothetical protein
LVFAPHEASYFVFVQPCYNFIIVHDQQIKALLENVGASMCPDHSDWFGNGGLDAQSRNVDKSVVTKFLQAHPADYATKKLQVSSLVSGRG